MKFKKYRSSPKTTGSEYRKSILCRCMTQLSELRLVREVNKHLGYFSVDVNEKFKQLIATSDLDETLWIAKLVTFSNRQIPPRV
jgi:hypothetical protein